MSPAPLTTGLERQGHRTTSGLHCAFPGSRPISRAMNALKKTAHTPVGSVRPDRDIIIVGGGHNGLVCAAYLAKAGLKVTVLERRDMVGGAAVTEESTPPDKPSNTLSLPTCSRIC